MAFILTRIHVNDYDAWKSIFDSDPPGARKAAKRHRILRAADDPNELFIEVEFPSPEEALAARRRLLDSGVLERVTLKAGPDLIEEAEAVAY
jgi:predicted nucleotidyltransferase